VKPNDNQHTDTGSVKLSKKELLQLLANPRRRYLLHRLTQSTHPFELQALARSIAAWEINVSPTTVSAEHIERVRVSLYHKHIPKLEAAELIDFDEQSEMISLDSTTSQLGVVGVSDGDLDEAYD
jgi:DNA-binding transcriptional ArsR family regulator